jgi:hypothetical protein
MVDHPDTESSAEDYTDAKVAGVCLLLAALEDDADQREARMLAQLAQLIQEGTDKIGRVLAYVTARTVLALTSQHGTTEAARRALADDLTALLEQERT